MSSVALGDVQGDAVTGASQLVGQCVLLVVRETAGSPDALDGEPLCVLPRLQCLVVCHVGTVQPNCVRSSTRRLPRRPVDRRVELQANRNAASAISCCSSTSKPVPS